MSKDEMNFDGFLPIEVPVSIYAKKYILREANCDAVCRYRNASNSCFRRSADGLIEITGPIADTEPLLVSLCLFPVSEDGTVASKSVTEGFVRDLPSRVTKKLVAKLKEISPIDEADESAEALEKEKAALEEKIRAIASLKNAQSTSENGLS